MKRENDSRGTAALLHRGITFGISSALALLPVIAMAQDPDDAPQPMDAHAKSVQLWTWSLAGLLIVLGLGLYWLRRWQISRADTHITPEDRD